MFPFVYCSTESLVKNRARLATICRLNVIKLYSQRSSLISIGPSYTNVNITSKIKNLISWTCHNNTGILKLWSVYCIGPLCFCLKIFQFKSIIFAHRLCNQLSLLGTSYIPSCRCGLFDIFSDLIFTFSILLCLCFIPITGN